MTENTRELAPGRKEAKARAAKIRGQLGRLAKLADETAQTITLAWESRDYETLGYESWPAYCESELGTALTKVHPGIRHAWIPALDQAGMKTGEIAAVCGTDRKTIQRDKAEIAATNVAPPDPTSESPDPETATNVAPEYSTPILQGEIHVHAHKAKWMRVPIGGECICGDLMTVNEQELDTLTDAITPYLDAELARYLINEIISRYPSKALLRETLAE